MRPGMVVSIRVNPKDCMGVLDVMNAAGVPTHGMSFPQMVSLALGSLLETARMNSQIDRRDGFEYLDMMSPYIGQQRTSKKIMTAKSISELGSGVRVPGLVKPKEESSPFRLPVAAPTELTIDQRLTRARLSELLTKKDLAEDGAVTWQASDEVEFQTLYKEVYPEG